MQNLCVNITSLLCKLININKSKTKRTLMRKKNFQVLNIGCSLKEINDSFIGRCLNFYEGFKIIFLLFPY